MIEERLTAGLTAGTDEETLLAIRRDEEHRRREAVSASAGTHGKQQSLSAEGEADAVVELAE
ncbi:MAG: hypothetical protein HYV60_19275 [Planctomycetia bacterium]|nr:hypothetical protein [Planctomycetia bacterium]